MSRERSPVTVLGVMFIALVIFTGIVGGFLVIRWDHAESQRNCIARLEGKMTASALEALAAPPVNPAATPAEVARTPRGEAIARGLAAARLLHNPDTAC